MKTLNPSTLTERKEVNISKIPLFYPFQTKQENSGKIKNFQENQISLTNLQLKKPSYTQTSKSDDNIIRIKNIFLKLFANKVSKIHQVINNSS